MADIDTIFDSEVAAVARPDPDYLNDRDAALKLIAWFDYARVKAAKVLVVGAGAIGNEVLKNLALLGVGNIYILDRDTIQIGNLSRSVLFRAADREQPKARIAANAVRQLNPTINVYWRQGDIDSDLGEGFVRQMNVVIGALDSVEARFSLNRLCLRAGRPWVDGGIGDLNGEVSVYTSRAACYECAFTGAHYRNMSAWRQCGILMAEAEQRGRVPTTPTIASVVAGVQVQECLKLLDPGSWDGRSLTGRRFTFNGTVEFVDIVGLSRREDCPAHSPTPEDGLHRLGGMSAGCASSDLLRSAQAQEVLGAGAFLHLDAEVAVKRSCPCGDVLPICRPVSRVLRGEVTCRNCGREVLWESGLETTHHVSSESDPALLAASLHQLGVPWFGVVEARAPGGRVAYLELSGDSASVMNSAVEEDK